MYASPDCSISPLSKLNVAYVSLGSTVAYIKGLVISIVNIPALSQVHGHLEVTSFSSFSFSLFLSPALPLYICVLFFSFFHLFQALSRIYTCLSLFKNLVFRVLSERGSFEPLSRRKEGRSLSH